MEKVEEWKENRSEANCKGQIDQLRSLRPCIVMTAMRLTLSLVKSDPQGQLDPIERYRSLVNPVQDRDTSFLPNQPSTILPLI